jgi:hypothetical protein
MKLNTKEEKILRRGLDKASSSAEAEMAAASLFSSLRKRGIDGYQILEELNRPVPMHLRQSAYTSNPPPQQYSAPQTTTYWRKAPPGSQRPHYFDLPVQPERKPKPGFRPTDIGGDTIDWNKL